MARIPVRSVWPFDVTTATGHGVIQSCLDWPPVQLPEDPPSKPLPDVPVLLLNGERHLSTPLAWAEETAAQWRDSRLVVTADDGHSVHIGDPTEHAQRAVMRFLQKEL